MVQYGKAAVPLADISEEYLGLTPCKANEMACLNQLPIATFRAGDCQKAPHMMHLSDLAELLDSQRAAAKRQWERSQAISPHAGDTRTSPRIEIASLN